MGAVADTERAVLHIPVEAPWLLGNDARCVISDTAISICSPIAEVRLRKGDFIHREGRVLHFCSSAKPVEPGCIEFAGLGRDAWYEVTCRDEDSAAFAVSRIEAMAGRSVPAEMRDLIFSLKPT